MHFPPEIVHLSASRFREPIIDTGEQAENRAGRDDVMKMGNHVVGVVQVKIGRVEGQGDPHRAPMPNSGRNATTQRIGTVNRIEPPQSEMKNALRMMTEGMEIK